MTDQQEQPAGTGDVDASLNYLRPGAERPVYIASKGGADAALSISAEFDEHSVRITDARSLKQQPSLDREGFCLLSHPTGVSDFYRFEPVQADYEAEISRLVIEATGALSA